VCNFEEKKSLASSETPYSFLYWLCVLRAPVRTMVVVKMTM